MKIGKVTHYYDKIGVAVIELVGNLAVGDKVKFVRGGEDLFSQTISSIQYEHKQLETAGKGDIVGIRVEKGVKEGAEIYKEN